MKSVLFVDDEAPILDGLRTRLHRATEWDMAFAASGAAALEQLEKRPFDVVVTDLRMPQMHGGELLQAVSVRWPETVRIVLSGVSEQQEAMNLASVAHQFMSKPCEVQQLRIRIERALQLHEFLRKPELRAAVGRIKKLPPMPRTYANLKAVLSREEASVGDVAKVVATDPIIAAKVLQMVNSAFFRLARRITNIDQAVGYLGFASVRNLVLSAEVFGQWPNKGRCDLDLEKLQLHAQHVAAATSTLSTGTQFKDDALLAALLHDIGYWVLTQEFSAEMAHAITMASDEGIAIHEAEARIIGASHAEIGAYLLGLWGLPYSVVEAVAHHHLPERVMHHEFDVLTSLAVAHALADDGDESVFGLQRGKSRALQDELVRTLPVPFGWAEAQKRVSDVLSSGDFQT